MSRLFRSMLLALLVVGSLGTASAQDLLVSSWLTNEVLRYDASSGAFLGVFVTSGSGMIRPHDTTIGPDRNLYVASSGLNGIIRHDGTTGALIDTFVPNGSGGLSSPVGVRFGPDGHLYVSSQANDRVLKYDGTSGAFVSEFIFDDPATVGVDETGGIQRPEGFAVGRDGDLYLAAGDSDAVFRYDGETGAFRDIFVGSGSGGLDDPNGLTFGRDGHLYVASFGTQEVLRYHGATGAFLGAFVTAGSGGLNNPHDAVFGPDGHLYVTSYSSDEILRYDGSSGAFLNAFVTAGSGGLDGPISLLFRPATRLDLFGPSPGTPGASSTLTVRSATSGQTVFFLLGFGQARFKVPSCVGLFMELALPLILGSSVADGNGVATLSANVPGLASDQRLWFQTVELASCRVSNVVPFTFPDTGGSASVVIDPGGTLKSSSTFNSGSFQITNTSSNGLKITDVELDLSTSILPDLVYDPFGQAGDTVGKNFTVDFDPGVGLTSNGFSLPHDLGFDRLDLTFNDFDSGEPLFFSVDTDPTTIQGSSAPGPNESGSISGLELIRARLRISFSDGSFRVAETYRRSGSVTGSEIVVQAGMPAAPSIEMLGLVAPAQTNQASQTVRVQAPIGSTVKLVQLEGGLFTHNLPGGGFDVDPFEANSAVAVTEQSASVGTSGQVDLVVTLTRADSDSGYNHFCAVVQDTSGRLGRLSQVLVVQLIP